MRYFNIGDKKRNGVVYTPKEVANYVTKEMLKYYIGNFSSTIKILDPAVGNGELLISMINALKVFNKEIIAIGYETDKIVAQKTQKDLKKMFPDIHIEIRANNFLKAVENEFIESFDFIIANPPYIRTQIIGSNYSQKMSEKLSLSGRIDIYYAFLIYAKKVLKPYGISGYITSNKFMTIKSGNLVRNYMLNNYNIHHITDLGDTKLFKASVLPCIIIFSLGKTYDKEKVMFTSVYQDNSLLEEDGQIKNLFDAIYKDGLYKTPNGRKFKFQQGKIKSVEENLPWVIESSDNSKWLSIVESNTWKTFKSIGKIRVGIKTTADNVFIGDNWIGEKENIELLQPLITHRNAGQIVANNKPQWKVLYTHTIINGKKVAYDIDLYPKTKEYLIKHFKQLDNRKYIKRANRNWYEIWVPQNPESWKHKKIVFRDISEQPEFWLDETGAIVNGDCYWIDINTDTPEYIIYLALAVANSKFIEKFYDLKFNTKLYSGKRRYQAQYVEQFPIPYYKTKLAKEAIDLVKKIITKTDKVSIYKKELDSIIDKIFSYQKNYMVT